MAWSVYSANPRLFEAYAILWISCQFLIIITLLYISVIMFSLLFVVALFVNVFLWHSNKHDSILLFLIPIFIVILMNSFIYYHDIIMCILLVGTGFDPFWPYPWPPWPRCHRQPTCVPWPRDRYGDQTIISSLIYQKRDVYNPTVGTMKL